MVNNYLTFDGVSTNTYDIYISEEGVFNAPERDVEMLTPLDPIPPAPEPEVAPPLNTHPKSVYAAKLLAKETGKAKVSTQLPKEMRLLFDPNSTQLSDSSVKWLSAYAAHVQKDSRLIFSIRISNKNWTLQQARLNLIIKLLIEKGLSSKQLRIFQSNRDENSMILSVDLGPDQTPIIVPSDKKRVIKEQKTLVW